MLITFYYKTDIKKKNNVEADGSDEYEYNIIIKIKNINTRNVY